MTKYDVIKGGQRIVVDIPDLPVKPKKTKRVTPFAQVELELAAKHSEAVGSPRTIVLVRLWYLAWKAKGQPFPFSSEALRKYGVSREVKRKVLDALEEAGLIRVERSGKRSPIITLLSITDDTDCQL
jgi:hypothetical protein